MPKFVRKFLTVLVAVSLISIFFANLPAAADISSCSASVSPHTITPTAEILFQFQVNNLDVNAVHWIKVLGPSPNFLIVSTFVDGWRETTLAAGVTLTRGSLNPGGALNFQIRARAEDVQAPPQNWIVLASDDPNGGHPASCSGDLATEISGPPPDYTPPSISGITTSDLTADSVTISWGTDEPATSKINWGLDDSYGDSKEDLNLTVDHAITLTGLVPDTGYHYQIESTDAAGNPGYSGDNTFLTPISSVVAPVIPAPSVPGKKKLVSTEKIPPMIKISTVLDKPFKEIPKIVGEAEDNAGLYAIDYSTDGGKNWLQADTVDGLGSKKVSFEFTPRNLEDGDYVTLARAIDTSGNVALSEKQTLVIDRLPPIVGGNVISIGPQILEPGDQGIILSLAGIDQKITLSAVGGPTSVNLIANSDSGKNPNLFSLTKSANSGLWSGILSFSKPGTYTLTANSIDGAGNKLSRVVDRVFVSKSPRVLEGKNNRPIEKAKITLYYLEAESNNWVVWDGTPYGQDNPQVTDKTGSFKLLVPAGKYYLGVQAAGFQTLISEIFQLDQPTPLVSDLSLKEAFKIKLGPISFPLPDFSVQKITLETDIKLKTNSTNQSLIDKEIPAFSLPSTSGQEVNSVSLRGKPTLVSFVSTWSPAAKEQLPALAALQKNQDINIVPISTLENLAKVAVYIEIAGYNLGVLVDKDGQTIERFNLQNLPTHYFVDRRGIIKKVAVGVLSKEEILNSLGGL